PEAARWRDRCDVRSRSKTLPQRPPAPTAVVIRTTPKQTGAGTAAPQTGRKSALGGKLICTAGPVQSVIRPHRNAFLRPAGNGAPLDIDAPNAAAWPPLSRRVSPLSHLDTAWPQSYFTECNYMYYREINMKTVSARQANHEFSSLLARAERGEDILITKRSKPVAILSPY